MAETPPYLTVAEVAETLRASTSWVRHRIHDGTIPHVQIGGRLLIPAAELQQLLEVRR